MTYAETIADGWDTIRTDRPLHEIATDQAKSRVLSPTTRAYFRNLVEPGLPPAEGGVHYSALDREAAFFEAAASYSTRKGQSYARRVALGDLHRLHVAVQQGQTILGPRYYATALPCTVVVHPDGQVEVAVDLAEVTQAVADTPQPGAVEDSVTVGYRLDRGGVDVHRA
jgi:hypothetical protein